MRRSPLAVVYLTVFIDLLGFSIILPLLPFYAEHYGASGVWVGALSTAYSAVQFLSAPVLGRLSDRVGRRPILLLSLAGSAASLAFTGIANTLWLLLVGRAVAGLFGGSISTAQAYVADVTPPCDRAKYMGLLGASIGMGFVCGPAIGAGLSRFGFGTAAFCAAGLAAANLVCAWFCLPESRPADREVRSLRSRGGLVAALTRRTTGRILAATFLTGFAFVGMEATFALYGQKAWGLDAAGFGLLFTYIGVLVVIVQGGLIRWLHRRYDERKLAGAGALIMAASLAALTAAPNVGVGLAVITGLAVGQGLVSPTLATLLSRESDAAAQGQILGLGQSFAAGARATGPIVAGWLYDRTRSLPYLAGAVLVLAAAWLLSQAAPGEQAAPQTSLSTPFDVERG